MGFSCCAALLFSCCTSDSDHVGYYIDPNIGGIAPLLTTVPPKVHRPHAMVRIYPITEPGLNDRYLSDRIYGITLNMPRYRLGEISSIMAASGPIDSFWPSVSSAYDHAEEEVHPWSHCIRLIDYGVEACWTTTERTSAFRFEFDRPEEALLLFRVGNEGEIEITEGHRIISGWERIGNARQYFHATILSPFRDSGTQRAGSEVTSARRIAGDSIVGWLASASSREVEVRIGISYISAEQARRNLERETAGKTFEHLVAESEQVWEQALGRIRVHGGTEREKRIFYTALYRTCERMVNQSEEGRYYSGFDHRIHTDSVPFYNDDWIWDTYRNLHALQMILDPADKAQHLQSYVRMYEQSGWMPNFPELTRWSDRHPASWPDGLREEPMIGNHTASLLAEAVCKGITSFDVQKAYEGVRKNALQGTMIPWRDGPATDLDRFYRDQGYFPALTPDEQDPCPFVDAKWEKRQAVSVTLEHSYNDWCLAQVARYLGYEEDYALFMARSRNYLNLWNPRIGYFAPKDQNGNWIEPFDPQLCGGGGARSYFAENNACVHVFHVQHDIPKLIELLGGRERFIERIDQAFNEPTTIDKWRFMGMMPDATGLHGMIPVGNEPAFHVPYLYNYAGAPWKTQYRVRQLAELWFDDSPSGLCGDEDGGALSAWYVFAAMGFYPVNPASGEYALTCPIFEKVEIALPGGGTFTIKAPGVSRRNKYIQSATLNGKSYNRAFLSHQDLMKGGCLEFTVGDRPRKDWGVLPDWKLSE